VVKIHSQTLRGQTVNISALKSFKNILFSTVSVCVAAVFDSRSWLGYAMETFEETGEIHIQFLHLHGPATFFTYPVQLDELTLPLNHIFSLCACV
jgi:hypothetical protein